MKAAKTQHDVNLSAYRVVGRTFEKCNTSNCETRLDFRSSNQNVIVTEYEDSSSVIVTTNKGEYHLKKHSTLNAYIGTCGKYKVRVTLKKVVGKITFLA